MSKLSTVHVWHQTRSGLLIFALVELGLAYVFVSLAIDRGSLLDYAVAIVLLIGGVHNIIKLILKMVGHGTRR